MDAMNLGWKLAATIRGVAPDGLLDTYSAERHPVGAAVLHNTRAQSALLAPGPHYDALRDIVSDLMDLPEVNRHLSQLLSGTTDRYPMPYASEHPLVGAHWPPLTVNGTLPLTQLTTEDGSCSCIPAPTRSTPLTRSEPYPRSRSAMSGSPRPSYAPTASLPGPAPLATIFSPRRWGKHSEPGAPPASSWAGRWSR